MLAGKGFDEVYNLKGGISAWKGYRATGPVEPEIIPIKGDETAEEIIALAYGMETGLGAFYLNIARTVDTQSVKDVLNKLAEVEEKHKDTLFQLYAALDPKASNRVSFETEILPDVMEGGITIEEFLNQNKDALQSEEDVLNTAMMLETQALDLYLRYSHKVQDPTGRSLLHQISDEEKRHLALLGDLLEEKSSNRA